MKVSILFLHISGVFLLAFLFILVLYVGLPIDFNADYLLVSIRSLDAVGYSDLIKLTLIPLTPGWFYSPARMIEYMRPLQILWFQLYHNWFPYSLTPFLVTAAVGHGLLAISLFSIIWHYTKRPVIAWFVILLYASLPSNFFIMASLGSFDFQYWVSLLSLGSLTLFSALTFGHMKRVRTFVFAVLGWIALIWIAIKLKSSEKILPLVCLAFVLLRSRTALPRLGRIRFLCLIAAITFSFLFVIPFGGFDRWLKPEAGSKQYKIELQPSTEKDRKTLTFHWEHGLQRTFFVRGGEFPFTTPHRHKMPQSFTENLGFSSAWFFWLTLGIASFLLTRKSQGRASLLPLEQIHWEAMKHFFILILLWFGAILFGFASGAALIDLRFLNFAYVPAVLLLGLSTHVLQKRFFASQKKRLFFLVLLIAIFGHTYAENFSQLGKLVGHFGGIQSVLVRAERDVFRSFFREEPIGVDFYKRHQELEDRALLIDWYNLPENWMEQAREKLAREGILYVYTRSPNSDRLKLLEEEGYLPTLWKRYDFLEAEPFIFRIFQMVAKGKRAWGKPEKKREILIYQVDETPLKAARPEGRAVGQ